MGRGFLPLLCRKSLVSVYSLSSRRFGAPLPGIESFSLSATSVCLYLKAFALCEKRAQGSTWGFTPIPQHVSVTFLFHFPAPFSCTLRGGQWESFQCQKIVKKCAFLFEDLHLLYIYKCMSSLHCLYLRLYRNAPLSTRIHSRPPADAWNRR